jgi:hypothetical protein
MFVRLYDGNKFSGMQMPLNGVKWRYGKFIWTLLQMNTSFDVQKTSIAVLVE